MSIRPCARLRACLPFAAVTLLAAPLALPAQQRPVAEGGDLLILLANADTVAVERFVLRGNSLESELLARTMGARLTLGVDLAPGGGASRFRLSHRSAAADATSPAIMDVDARFSPDSVIVEMTGGGRSATQRFATRAQALPLLNPSIALLELIVRQARAAGGDSVTVPVWNAQGGTTVTASVVRHGADSVLVMLGPTMRLAVSPQGELLGGVIPAQNVTILRVRGGGPASALAAEKPDYSAPAGAPYTAEDVKVASSAGHVLAGTLTLPTGRRGRVPAVVTITGSGPEDRDEAIPGLKGYRPFRQLADTLGRNGIAVLRLDDRGWGASTGRHETATSEDFADDIRAALAWLRSRPEIDPERLALVGHSEGGLIAPMVAVREPALRGIVLMAGPSQKGREILTYQIGNQISASPTLSAAQKDSALRTVPRMIDSLAASSVWLKFFLDYDPLATARRVKVPVLVMQGETDRQVTAQQATALADALRAGGNRDVALQLFPRANHLFVEDADGIPSGYASLPSHTVRSDVLGALVSWLRVKLR